jgi:hypothetical protein
MPTIIGIPDPADGTPGAAVPPQALWVAGTDGTYLRGLLTDAQGRLVITPTAPSTSAGQHPVVERQWAASNFSATGNLLPAPGAGLRYRVYWAKIIYTGGTGVAYIAGPYRRDPLLRRLFALPAIGLCGPQGIRRRLAHEHGGNCLRQHWRCLRGSHALHDRDCVNETYKHRTRILRRII